MGQELGKKDQELGQKGKMGQELGKKDQELGQKGKMGQELGKKDQELNQKGKMGQELGKKDQELGQKGKMGQELGKKDQELGQKGKMGQELGKKDQELGQKGKMGQELGKNDQKPDQQSQEQKLKPGDIGLQIANETDFALSVRASLVDASERVNLTKAKSVSLAAHSRGMIALSPMNAGKVSLAPVSAQSEVSKDSKILLTVNRGKETRRLVVGYANSAGTIVLGKDLFPDAQEQQHPKEPQSKNEEIENKQQKEVSSSNAQTIYIINQTGIPLTYDAILKPTSFDPLQGELKPGANALRFSSKKALRPISKEKIGLTIQMKYNLPGSPAVTFKKEALDLESNPTVVINKAIMGEPTDPAAAMKKPK